MARFLAFKRDKVTSGELSLATLDGYLKEVQAFVAFQKPGTPAAGLRPGHFSAYMRHMVEARRLGRFARKRVVTYLNTFLRFGEKNGWTTMPNPGVDWVVARDRPRLDALARAGRAPGSLRPGRQRRPRSTSSCAGPTPPSGQ